MANEHLDRANIILKDVYYKYSCLIDDEKGLKINALKFIKDQIIPLMKKKDILFSEMFEEVCEENSFIDRLRTNNAKECSLAMLLKLPILDDSSIEFKDGICDPGFTMCALNGGLEEIVTPTFVNQISLLRYKLLLKGTKGFILSPSRTRAWFYRILHRILLNNELRKTYLINKLKDISLKTSGPTMTLEFKSLNGLQVNIDVFPAFAFKCHQILHLDSIGNELKTYWGSTLTNKFDEYLEITKHEKFYIYDTITPKPDNLFNKCQWRLHFVESEKRIMYQNGCCHTVVGLLQNFRDCNPEVQKLSNYALKTIVMLLVKEYPSFIWNEENISAYFLISLTSLHEKLRMSFLPFYFHSMSNIFDNLSPEDLTKMELWLKKVIEKLKFSHDKDKCSVIWKKYFEEKKVTLNI